MASSMLTVLLVACGAASVVACASDESLSPLGSGSTGQTTGAGPGPSSADASGTSSSSGAGAGGSGVGAGGAAGTSAGGAGAAGAASSGASGGGGSTSGTGGGSGANCTWGSMCAPGFFCDAPGCGAGTCKEKPPAVSEKKQLDPICGCDHVTYWNSNIAEIHGVPVKSSGVCPPADATPCSTLAPCAIGLTCNEEVTDATGCALDAGTCWGTPVACALNGPKARACTNAMCELECSLIQSNHAWYEDASCP